MSNELLAICLGIALSSIIIGAIALKIAITAWVEVKAMANSTHQVQYYNPEAEADSVSSEDLDKQMEKALGSEYTEREYV